MDVIRDRRGDEIYITDERWEHIYKRHPDVIGYEEYVFKTVRFGKRRQQPLEFDIFKYSRFYDDLPEFHLQMVVVVKFAEKVDEKGQVIPNNFVITAYMK